MLKHIAVDGFRSLIDFKIDLRPGLNVLVGSNGTGKSNFITFLDFLGSFIEGDLNSAIAVAGGAGAAFSKEKFVAGQGTVVEATFSMSGEVSTDILENTYMYFGGQKKPSHIKYDYECKLKYISSVPAVFVSYEKVTTSSGDGQKLIITRSTDRIDGKFVSDIDIRPHNHKEFDNIKRWNSEIAKGKAGTDKYFASFLLPDCSLLSAFRGGVQALSAIAVDLTSYRSVNIDPAASRRPTPVGTTVEIKPNGEGLAGTLYSLSRGNYFRFEPSRMMRRRVSSEVQLTSHRNIMSWCREVNSSIYGVEVDLDFEEAQFKPKMIFSVDGNNVEFSFARISDGTVKWLSLITILHVDSSLSIVEEPENFLHPFMQESFIALCRQLIMDDNKRPIIITTHSPTILDCCSPNELTIFELCDGRSTASQVQNRLELSEKIQSSRFGLGYYYRTGGVYGADSGPS